jgi:C1A family cysteine protease
VKAKGSGPAKRAPSKGRSSALVPRRRFGWKPDLPDQRDRKFPHMRVLRRLRMTLPKSVDLRSLNLHAPVFDQGNLGSCTANAIGKAFEFAQRKRGRDDYAPSRLFIYYGERELEDTIPSDDGAEIRDGLKVVNKLGAPHETLWPYLISRFAERPDAAAYTDGLQHQALAYASVDVSSTAVRAALAAGYPVVVGFTVYESFYRIGANGFMPVPKPNEAVEGGHAVLVMGYRWMKAPWDRSYRPYAIVLNSWGASWGDQGFFYMPLAWLCNRYNADDFWTISDTEAAA